MEKDKEIITSNSNKYISPQTLKNNDIVEEDQNESQLEVQQTDALHSSKKLINTNNQVVNSTAEDPNKIVNAENTKSIEEYTIKQEQQGQIKDHLTNQCLQASPQKVIQSSRYKLYRKKANLTKKKLSQGTQTTKANDNQIKQLQITVSKNKLVKEIFTHFCKQNNLSSIKSTLFSEKHKTIEEMSLNKWMVFCKQFEINQHLCSLKVAVKTQTLRQSQIRLESSQVREQIRMKQMKQVNITLANIFHKAAQHLSKMTYPQFSIALRLLYEQFKLFNQADIPTNAEDFIKKHLFCNNQAECFNKLSNLKFTNGIAKIDYHIHHPQYVENRQANPITNKQNNQGLKKSMSLVVHQHSNMALHSIIKDAKSSLAQVGSQSIRNVSKRVSKLQLQEIKKKPKKKVEKKGLYDYFDSTHDDILESYFEVQKMVKTGSYSLQ